MAETNLPSQVLGGTSGGVSGSQPLASCGDVPLRGAAIGAANKTKQSPEGQDLNDAF